MRLGLYFYGHPKGLDHVWYHIGIREPNGNIRKPSDEEAEKLQFHHMKINEVAANILGDKFSRSFFEKKTGEIELCFAKGVSTGSARFDFKVFCGWVELSLL